MSDTPAPNNTRSNTHDLRKLYKAVRFQQGRPVLDTELNDLQDMSLAQLVAELKKEARFSGVETSPFEWALLPLGNSPTDDKNIDNIGFTVGRLPTTLGMIDTSLDEDFRLAFDHQALVDNGTDDLINAYSNYLFKGVVSSVDPALPAERFVDQSKAFEGKHLLTTKTTTLDLSTPDNQNLILNVSSGSCRVVFTSANNVGNVGVVRTITAFTTNSISFDALPEAVTAGDEYVIIPDNQLKDVRERWNSANVYETAVGAEHNPIQFAVVQTWDEDISSNEDPTIEHAPIGLETSHRTQLRWCLRVLNLYGPAITSLGNSYQRITSYFGTPDQSDALDYSKVIEVKDLLRTILDVREVPVTQKQIMGAAVTAPDQDIGSTSTLLEGEFLTSEASPYKLVGSTGVYSFAQAPSPDSEAAWRLNFTSYGYEADAPNRYGVYHSLPTMQGTSQVTADALQLLGSSGLLDFTTLKAFALIHAFTTAGNINDTLDFSVLGMWSAPSKRLDIEWLANGSNPQSTAGYQVAIGQDTLSPYFWVNSIAEGVDSNSPMTVPRIGIVTPTTDGFSAQPSLYVTPPRTYLRSSEASTELLRARSLFYGAEPAEMMESLRKIYHPSEISRLVARERITGVFTPDAPDSGSYLSLTYASVNQRLDFLENIMGAVTGLSTSRVLQSEYASPLAQELYRAPTLGNVLLSDEHSFGAGQAGTGSMRISQADRPNDLARLQKYLSGNVYEDGSVSFGGVNFVNPTNNVQGMASLGDSLQQVVPRKTQDAGYNGILSRETIDLGDDLAANIENEILSGDPRYGYTQRKGVVANRNVHEGIEGTLAFIQAFNFRKLAVKTTAHASADLFTMDVPHWWNLMSESEMQLAIRNALENIVDGNGDPTGEVMLPPSFFTAMFNSVDGREGVAMSSSLSPLRNTLAKVDTYGPMGISSVSSLGKSAPIGSTSPTQLTRDTGVTATNNRLLPFLNQISGSTPITRWDNVTTDENTYDIEADTTNAVGMLEQDRGAWGRAKTPTDAIIAASQGQSPFPAFSTITNRCTSMRLRYHIGDFYPGELDERGIPSNLLVDSLNLFMRIEPLPLVHWMTMPKHQHSILEGSMDMSEAIATLLDISNGRGIPDHLFTNSASYVPVNADRNLESLLNISDESLPNAALNVRDMITGLTSRQQLDYERDYAVTPFELLERMYQSVWTQALHSVGIFVLTDNATAVWDLADTELSPTIKTFSQVNGSSAFGMTGVAVSGLPGDTAADYPKIESIDAYFIQLTLESNGAAEISSYTKRWTSTTAWHDAFELWREGEADPSQIPTATTSFSNLVLGGHLRDFLEAYYLGISFGTLAGLGFDDTNIDISGNIDLSYADIGKLRTGTVANTIPVISHWLARGTRDDSNSSAYTALMRMFPALGNRKRTAFDNGNSVSFEAFEPMSLFSRVRTDKIPSLIKDHMEANGYTASQAVSDLLTNTTQYGARIGSIDPVGVCIPSSAHPYVHWWHPNMRGVTAPNGGEGFMLTTGENAQEANETVALHYTPYNEWGRDSMIMTGIVPFGQQAERFRRIMGYNAITNFNSPSDSVSLAEGGFLDGASDLNGNAGDTVAEFLRTSNSDIRTLTNALYNGIFRASNELTQVINASVVNLPEASDPFSPLWDGMVDTDNNGVGEPVELATFGNASAVATSMIPYFSYSTGVIGLGSVKDNVGTPLAPELQYSTNDQYISSFEGDGVFDMWANWFPYTPNVTQQRADDAQNIANAAYSLNLRTRITESIFGQRTGPVYLPASRVVYNKTKDYSTNKQGYAGSTDAQETPLQGFNNNDFPSTNYPSDQASESIPVNKYVDEYNVGYHPMLQAMLGDLANEPVSNQDGTLRAVGAYPLDDISTQIIDIMTSIADQRPDLLDDSNGNFIYPETNGTKPFDGTSLRAGLSTETMGWINLYVKTYNQTYGHDSIHPYGYLQDPSERPKWHKDFENGKGVISGKGPDQDVDTLYVGDLGTGIYATRRASFQDPLCLGVGAVRSSGGVTHDSAVDSAEVLVFRDVFELCNYERENYLAQTTDTTAVSGLIRTSTAWSKMGMQAKLLFNSSIRVLHTRPSGAVSMLHNNATGVANNETNYGFIGGSTKSITEMFLTVDPVTNKMFKNNAFNNITSARRKPYLQLEPLVVNQDHGVKHPNYDLMKRLRPLVSSDLSGKPSDSSLIVGSSIDISTPGHAPDIIVKGGDNLANRLGDTDLTVAERTDNRSDEQVARDLSISMGDAFDVDPFDLMWDEALSPSVSSKMENKNAFANTANNSGVEYELLSSLARIHAQAPALGLHTGFRGNANIGLIDTMPTPNELTLPGDHEIVFVLYTGDHGAQMVNSSVPVGANPPVAGCHIKATIEVNRPSERYDSQMFGERGVNTTGMHYGVTNAPLPNVVVTPTGLSTHTIAGGRATADLAVYDASTGQIITQGND